MTATTSNPALSSAKLIDPLALMSIRSLELRGIPDKVWNILLEDAHDG